MHGNNTYRVRFIKTITSVWLVIVSQVGYTQYLEDNKTYSSPDSLDIVHYNEVRLTPDFWAQAGSNIHVYIDTSLIRFTPEEGVVLQEPDHNAIGSYNYIYSVWMREAEVDPGNLGSRERIETIDYFDGLGRPSQSVTIQGSPLNKDMVQPIVYDDFGREKFKYLPYVTNSGTGKFVADAVSASKNFYSNGIEGHDSDATPFKEILFDNSPLNRPTGEKGVGTAYHGHPSQINYLSNTASEQIKGWSGSGDLTTFTGFTYGDNQLYVTEFVDEDGHSTREYKDKLGQVVCKAANNMGAWLRTYYIYDDFGLLRCVIPPKANGVINDELCYKYTYDERKRMTIKDLPGAEAVYMVYDVRDRLVLVQDGKNREEAVKVTGKWYSDWLFTEYDQLNRPIQTGIIKTNDDQSTIQANFGDQLSLAGAGYQGSEIYSETKYDDYNFVGEAKYEFDTYNAEGLNVTKSVLTKGTITGNTSHVVKNSDDNILKTELLSVTYYDSYGRASRIISDNHLGGLNVTDNLYTFAGEPVKNLQRLYDQNGQPVIRVLTSYEYDHQGRLISETVQVNDDTPVIVAAFKYNELGEQIARYLHGDASSQVYNQKVDYSYNIKGWLSRINNGALGEERDLFALKLDYAAGNLFNGNISAMGWQNPSHDFKGYSFEYDGLNRLDTAIYGEGADLNQNTGLFNTGYRYDSNGNITALNRYMNGNAIDKLEYSYENGNNSNRLLSVDEKLENDTQGYIEGSGTYLYDANGNMKYDPSKNTDIEYNYLNLPKKVTFSGTDNARYIYSGGGTKLSKVIADELGNVSKQFDYVGSFLYENNELKTIFTSAGRIVPIDNNGEVLYQFEYNLHDHLGNTRVVFGGNNNGRAELLQTTDYYPFGLVINQQNYFADNVLPNKFLYNGKELQDDELAGVKLDWYDYGARFYDPELGRWHSVDPLAENHYSQTSYHYVFNNPMRFIDLFGLDTLEVINVYAPRINPSQPVERSILDRFRAWFESKFGNDAIQGNHNPRKVRDATEYEEWLIRNFDQERVREMGETFGAQEADPTLNNTVRTSESFRGDKTSDAEIKKQHAGNDETTSTGIKIDTLIKTFDPKKHNANNGGYIIDIHDKKAKDGDTIYFKIFYHSNDKLDSVKSLHESDNKTIYLK